MSTDAAAEAAAADPSAKTGEQPPAPRTGEELWRELQESKNRKPGDEGEEPKQQETAAAAPTSEKTEAKPAEKKEPEAPDIWAEATPEQKAAFEAAQQKARSNSGRISALQRKINSLTSAKEKRGEANTPARDTVSSLKDDYPELHEPLDRLASRVDEREAADKSAADEEIDATAAELNALMDAEEATLASRHSDWLEILTKDDARKKEFNRWLNDVAPNRLYQASLRNKQGIVDAAGAIEVIDAFKKHLGITPPAVAANPAPQPKPTPGPKPLDDKRQRQLASNAAPQPGIPRGIASTDLPAEGDGEEMWKQYQEQKRRARAAR